MLNPCDGRAEDVYVVWKRFKIYNRLEVYVEVDLFFACARALWTFFEVQLLKFIFWIQPTLYER